MKDRNYSDNFPNPFSMDGNFHVLEQRVPIEVQMDYFNYSNRIRKKDSIRRSEDDYGFYMEALRSDNTSAARKRHILSTFAIIKDVKVYRMIEEFMQSTVDPDISDWANLAMMESRISIETELLEERQIYISTGLGGKGNRLRFCILMFANNDNNEPFMDYQRQIVEREFAYYFPKEDCEVERLSIHDSYIVAMLLIPMKKDVKNLLDYVLTECNQYGNFISGLVTVTNVKEFTEEEIEAILKSKDSRGSKDSKDEEPL